MTSNYSKVHNTIVYIDGFNLYYSLKNTPYKWLNISKLVESVLDPRWHKIIKIKYFTARSPFSESAHRQEFYLKAIRSLQNVEIVFGKFKKRDLKASLVISDFRKLEQVKQIVGGSLIQFQKYEEKETDVNIATHIIYDCCKENISSIALLSNDTDLKLPLWFARKKLKKRVVTITPTEMENGSLISKPAHYNLRKISNLSISVTESHLKACLFPNKVGKAFKPKKWM